MADCPEIGLAPSEEKELGRRTSAEISTAPQSPSSGWEYEKDFENESITSARGHESDRTVTNDFHSQPIHFEYLTFETELPQPASLVDFGEDARLPMPACPDLAQYGSPLEWSPIRKNVIIAISCTATALTAFTAGSYSPALEQMTSYWHISNVACLTGITVFTCGFAIAPMVLAPFSEINGRRPVFIVSGLLFVLSQVFCAVTRLFSGMLISRFLAGVGGSTFSTMVGGVVSDIYVTKDRNTPMALFSGAALFGTGLGPLVCGFIAQNTTWRWVFYLQVITLSLIMVAVVLFFKETRGSVLLSRKGKALNQWYERLEQAGYHGLILPNEIEPEKRTIQRLRWKVKADEERTSLLQSIKISLTRPFHLLLTESVVFWFSLWVSFSWAVLYLTLAAIPLVFTTNHGFSISQNGAVFTSMCVGAALATLLSIYQEKWAKRNNWLIRNTPEDRLYFTCAQSVLMPIGLFLFGWTSSPDIHWVVPTIAIGLATMGIFSIYLAVFNYLADTYHLYASSALAAQSFCRNMLGGAFPLVTVQMYKALGFGVASSVLGAIGVALTAVPFVLVIWGPRIRARSPFASQLDAGV